MFSRFIKDFRATAAYPVQTVPATATLWLSQTTRIETKTGWKDAWQVEPGDCVATLDGGFARVLKVDLTRLSGLAVRVPTGALGNCSDFVVPAEAYLGFATPARASIEAPYLALPAEALVGHRGIHDAPFGHEGAVALSFADEEMVWVQTGTLAHAASGTETFYPRLSYGAAKGVLAIDALD